MFVLKKKNHALKRIPFHSRQSAFFSQAYIEGYIDLFSITTYCRLNLTMEAFELLIRGNFMGLIKAEVFVAANYPLYGLGGIKFYVKVEVDLYALNKVMYICVWEYFLTGIRIVPHYLISMFIKSSDINIDKHNTRNRENLQILQLETATA